MTDQENIPATRNGWRGPVQAIFGSVVLFILVWMFDTVQNISLGLVRQTEQIIALSNQIEFVSAQATDDRYRGAAAARDFALRDERMVRLSETVNKDFSLRDKALIALDKRLERIERIVGSIQTE